MQDPLTLVFAMSGVGSSAVAHALSDGPSEVFHVHTLNPRALENWQSEAAEAPRKIRESLRVLEVMRAHEGRVRIVTLVRDAVERNLAAAFNGWRRAHRRHDLTAAMPSESPADRWQTLNLEGPLRWFDRQMMQGLGIDVYRHPFPDTGYTAFREDRYDVLVMRTDLPDWLQGELLTEFSGHQARISGTSGRDRPERSDSDAFQDFCARVPLGEEWLRRVAESPYMQHFFAPQPETYIREWLQHRRLTERSVRPVGPS